MAQGGLRPSVIPAHERESRRGGGDGLPSARERRSIVRHSEERSEEESVPRRCARTAPTPHRHSLPRTVQAESVAQRVCTGATDVGAVREPPLRDLPSSFPPSRIGVRGRRRAGIQGRGVGTWRWPWILHCVQNDRNPRPFLRMQALRHSRPRAGIQAWGRGWAPVCTGATEYRLSFWGAQRGRIPGCARLPPFHIQSRLPSAM